MTTSYVSCILFTTLISFSFPLFFTSLNAGHGERAEGTGEGGGGKGGKRGGPEGRKFVESVYLDNGPYLVICMYT